MDIQIYMKSKILISNVNSTFVSENVHLTGSSFYFFNPRSVPAAAKAVAILQAGRRRISVAPYVWQLPGAWQLAGEPRVVEWPLLFDELAAETNFPVYACGEIDETGLDGLRRLKDRVVVAVPGQALRRAGYLAEIGWERLRQQRMDDAATLAPVYGGPA